MQERILLQPAKIRGTLLLANDAAEPVELGWADLTARLDPEKSSASKLTLRSARPGDFVGTRKKGARTVIFRIDARAPGACNIEWLLRKIPDFGETLCEVFRVEQVAWGAQMTESAASG